MKHGYSFRSFLTRATLIFMAFLLLSLAFVGTCRSYVVRDERREISRIAGELTRLSSAYAESGSLYDWDLRTTFSAIARSTETICTLCDSDGTVISCSCMEPNCVHYSRTPDSELLSKTLSEGTSEGRGTMGGFYDTTSYYASSVIYDSDGNTLGVVLTAAGRQSLTDVWGEIIALFFMCALVIFIIILIAGYVITYRQTEPLTEMAAAARSFAHGDFSVRVNSEERTDEIGALASAFNQMAESLEQSEVRRSDFIANVAHELKTPMTSISGFADGILDGTIPPELQRRYLETISSETKRLNRLVRRMLKLTQIEAMPREELLSKTFDLNELLLRTFLVFEKKINDKNLEPELLLPEQPVIVHGDSDSINQVIYNLLENAIKFSPPGSPLGVRLFRENGKAYVAIRNHGETIPPEELSRLFERFHKTDRSRSTDRDGVGLGLYIAKSIISSHDEDIIVTSKNGITEFVFSLTPTDAKTA